MEKTNNNYFSYDYKYKDLKTNTWGLGIGDWAQSPIPNPQSPIPNPQSPIPCFIAFISIQKSI